MNLFAISWSKSPGVALQALPKDYRHLTEGKKREKRKKKNSFTNLSGAPIYLWRKKVPTKTIFFTNAISNVSWRSNTLVENKVELNGNSKSICSSHACYKHYYSNKIQVYIQMNYIWISSIIPQGKAL